MYECNKIGSVQSEICYGYLTEVMGYDIIIIHAPVNLISDGFYYVIRTFFRGLKTNRKKGFLSS